MPDEMSVLRFGDEPVPPDVHKSKAKNAMARVSTEQILSTSEAILEDLRQLISRCRAPASGPARLQVILILTMAEQFEATLRLARAQMSTHAATHARSMIEALVAMKMLESRPDYVEQMTYERLRGEQRVYKGIVADPNLPHDLKQPIREKLDGCNSACQVLRSKGFKPKKISDDLGSAGLWHLVGPYSMLCAFSHNDLAALAFRHEGETGMAYRQGDTPEMVEAVVSTALQVLMVATEQIGRLARFEVGHFDPIFTSMNQKWRGLLPTEEVAIFGRTL